MANILIFRPPTVLHLNINVYPSKIVNQNAGTYFEIGKKGRVFFTRPVSESIFRKCTLDYGFRQRELILLHFFTSAIAVELEIMQTARMTFAKSPPGTTVGGW